MHSALKSGEATVEEMFPKQEAIAAPGAKPKDLNEAFDRMAEGKQGTLTEEAKPKTETRRTDPPADIGQSRRGAMPDDMEAAARTRGTRQSQPVPDPEPADTGDEDSREQSPRDLAFDAGYGARREGRSRKAVPKFPSEAEAAAWAEGWDMADAEAEG
jgi:hypothetical protein